MNEKDIELLEQLVDNQEYCRCSMNNNAFDICYDHISAIENLLKEYKKEKEKNSNIVCLKFREIEYWDDDSGDFDRYVVRDENFEKNFEELSNLILKYENFQEIENFLTENFQEIKMEDYEINY